MYIKLLGMNCFNRCWGGNSQWHIDDKLEYVEWTNCSLFRRYNKHSVQLWDIGQNKDDSEYEQLLNCINVLKKSS